jgi:hypothetical protein
MERAHPKEEYKTYGLKNRGRTGKNPKTYDEVTN